MKAAHPLGNRRRCASLLIAAKGSSGINAEMLTKQLHRLEKDGAIPRTVYQEVPQHVEYRITDFGKTLIPILEALCDWGLDYLGIDEDSAGKCNLRKEPGLIE